MRDRHSKTIFTPIVFVLLLGVLVFASLACGDDTSSAGGDGDVEIQESGRDRDIDADSSSNPCARFDCSPGYCKAYYDSGYCVCPEGWTFDQINMRCVEDETPDGDADKDVKDPDTDGDSEPDVDQEQPKVVKTYSHTISYDDELLEPGEIRITTGESGFASPFLNYDVNNNWVAYCTRDMNLFVCSWSTKACYQYDILSTNMDCLRVNVHNNILISETEVTESLENPDYYGNVLILDLESEDYSIVYTASKYHYHLTSREGNVVWKDLSYGIYYYLSDGKGPFNMSETAIQSIYRPKISGKYISWDWNVSESPVQIGYIMLYDIKSQETLNITEGTETANCVPAVSNKWVAYIKDCMTTYNPDGKSELAVYDIEQKNNVEFNIEKSLKYAPEVNGNKFVWMDFRNGEFISEHQGYSNPDIYFYDADKCEHEIPLSRNTDYQDWPRIQDRYVIYYDQRWHRGVSDIVVFDLCTLDIYKDDEMCAGGKKL